MRTHIILLRGDRRGSLGVLAAGSGGAGSQEAAITRLGGTLLGQYVVAGRYDLVLIVQLPSSEALLAFCLLQNAFGLYAEPMEAITADSADRVSELAESLLGHAQEEKGQAGDRGNPA